jgi:hypothetical protein
MIERGRGIWCSWLSDVETRITENDVWIACVSVVMFIAYLRFYSFIIDLW